MFKRIWRSMCNIYIQFCTYFREFSFNKKCFALDLVSSIVYWHWAILNKKIIIFYLNEKVTIMTFCNIKLCLHLIKIGVFGILQNFSIIIFKYKFPWKMDLISISPWLMDISFLHPLLRNMSIWQLHLWKLQWIITMNKIWSSKANLDDFPLQFYDLVHLQHLCSIHPDLQRYCEYYFNNKFS